MTPTKGKRMTDSNRDLEWLSAIHLVLSKADQSVEDINMMINHIRTLPQPSEHLLAMLINAKIVIDLQSTLVRGFVEEQAVVSEHLEAIIGKLDT